MLNLSHFNRKRCGKCEAPYSDEAVGSAIRCLKLGRGKEYFSSSKGSGSIQVRSKCIRFFDDASLYGEELLAARPTPKLEDHALSAVRDCLFNIFAATLYIGGRSSIRNLMKCRAVVHLSPPSMYGGRGELYAALWWGNLRERSYVEDPGVDWRIILRWIFRRWAVRVWTGSSWLKIGTGGGHL